MKMLCILNPIAGGGKTIKQVISALHETCRKSLYTCDIMITQEKGDGTILAKRGVAEGYEMIVAVGGDGTMNEVASGIVGTPATLGIIPVGSGNGLARGLGIPLNYQEACRLLVHGHGTQIDVGQVNGRYFFVTSGIGFDAHVGKMYDECGHHRGFLPYVQFAMTEFFHYHPQEVSLTCNGSVFRYTPFVLTVANIEQYGSGAIIAPGASPDDGVFDISVIPQCHFLQMAPHIPKLFTGTIDTFPLYKRHRASSLTIARTVHGPAHVDGEPFEAGVLLTYTLLPRALNVRTSLHKV